VLLLRAFFFLDPVGWVDHPQWSRDHGRDPDSCAYFYLKEYDLKLEVLEEKKAEMVEKVQTLETKRLLSFIDFDSFNEMDLVRANPPHLLALLGECKPTLGATPPITSMP
jgi:hypothetical protein